MNKLNKKLYRDIINNKSQFLNIFIMIFLGVFVFSGIHAYMDGMKSSGEKYYAENNLQDIWVTGINFTEEDLDKIKEIENVKDAERILTVNTELIGYENITIEANFLETNNISEMYVVDGEQFDENQDGVWFDSYLAENLGLNVGDEITFKYHNIEMTKEILGLIMTPDHVYIIKDETAIFPTHKDYGYIYLSVNTLPEEYRIFSSIIVDIEDEAKIDETKMEIESKIDSALAVTDRESNSSYVTYNSEIEEGNTFSAVFTILFLFIALLSVMTTMNRFIKKQRTQIGTLKALGMKKTKIILHYISYGFFISIIASVLGLILGSYFIGRYFLKIEIGYFEIPEAQIEILPIVYILACLVVILVTVVTYLSCRKILKESAIEALRVERPKIKKIKIDITSKKIFKKLSISTKWNIRDIMRNKGRSIMAIVGVVGCTMLLVCAFGMLDTMNSYLDWQFDKLSNFNYKIVLSNNYTQEQLNNLIEKYGDATSQTLGIEFKNGDKKETNILTVNDAPNHLKYTDHNKEYMDLEDTGVYITEKLAEKYNLKIGDEITWHIYGDEEWYTTTIIGLNRDPQSQQLNMTRSFYESLGLEYKPDSLYTNEDMSNIKNLEGVDVIQSIDNLKEGMESMLGAMKSMVILLIIVSAILGFVIIYNLGILSFSEKQYQFATLKVLGFKDKSIKEIFIKQNLWLAVIGIIIGLPLGYLMTDYIFTSALGDSYDFSASIKIISYVYAIFGSLIVAIVVNKILSRKVKDIDMVTSLKGNE